MRMPGISSGEPDWIWINKCSAGSQDSEEKDGGGGDRAAGGWQVPSLI